MVRKATAAGNTGITGGLKGINNKVPPMQYDKPPKVTAATKKALLAAFNKATKLSYGNGVPIGVRFVRVPLLKESHPDGFSYTALIPVGAVRPGVKVGDPNKAGQCFIERTGGFAGITQVAGPVKF